MSTKPIHRWIHLSAVLIVSIASIVYATIVSIPSLIFCIVWGGSVAVGMENAIRDAPIERWEQKTTWVRSILSYLLLISVIFLPVIIVIFWSGPLLAVSLAVVILLSMSVISKMITTYFGPRIDPNVN